MQDNRVFRAAVLRFGDAVQVFEQETAALLRRHFAPVAAEKAEQQVVFLQRAVDILFE